MKWTPLEAAGDIHRWQMDYPWELAKLDTVALKPGDVIEYHLEATDNFDFQGQRHDPASSGKYRITIMSQDQFTTLMGDLMSQVREQLVEIRNDQRGLKEQTSDLRNETQKQPHFNRADSQQADNLIDKQTTAASQARQSAQRLDEILGRMQENKSSSQDLKDIASAVRDDLNEVAEHPMEDAAAQIGDAKPNRPMRRRKLDSAQSNQQERGRQAGSDGRRDWAKRAGCRRRFGHFGRFWISSGRLPPRAMTSERRISARRRTRWIRKTRRRSRTMPISKTRWRIRRRRRWTR